MKKASFFKKAVLVITLFLMLVPVTSQAYTIGCEEWQRNVDVIVYLDGNYVTEATIPCVSWSVSYMRSKWPLIVSGYGYDKFDIGNGGVLKAYYVSGFVFFVKIYY